MAKLSPSPVDEFKEHPGYRVCVGCKRLVPLPDSVYVSRPQAEVNRRITFRLCVSCWDGIAMRGVQV